MRPRQTTRSTVSIAVLLSIGLSGALASAQTVTLEPVGVIPGPVEHVRVQGDYAYVSHHTSFTIWDVSNPAAPRRMGSTEFPEEIWGFRIRGDRVYVGANFFGLGILDISDPAAPTLLGSHKSLGQTKIGAVYENRVVLIDHMEGMVMVDISNETAPTGAGSFFLDGYARDVVTSGKMAYATDSPTGLYVFDLSVPGEPVPVGILHAPASPRFIEVQREEGAPSGILAGAGGGQLQIYDATNPAMPVKAATSRDAGPPDAGRDDGLAGLCRRYTGRRYDRGHLDPIPRRRRPAPSRPTPLRVISPPQTHTSSWSLAQVNGKKGRRKSRFFARPCSQNPYARSSGSEDPPLRTFLSGRRDKRLHPATVASPLAESTVGRFLMPS